MKNSKIFSKKVKISVKINSPTKQFNFLKIISEFYDCLYKIILIFDFKIKIKFRIFSNQ